jgi:hypothetical protein
MATPTTFNPTVRRPRRTSWVLTSLQTGAVLFAAGLTLLYLNPFWHFDEGGFLDWRVHWWNVGCQVFMGAGLLIASLAVIGLLAAFVSRLAGRPWPYLGAVLLVLCVIAWTAAGGFVRDFGAHFEWNSTDGFTVFRLQTWDEAASAWLPAEIPKAVQSTIGLEIQPLLRGYFKLNDWQKMNGDISIKVARIIPLAWPAALGNGGETLEDPDETPLMRAAIQGDMKAVQQFLSAGAESGVNALDQGGQSALILACQSQKPNANVVKALLAAGANVNLRSRNGYTALTWALARNQTEVVRMLRKAGGRR